MSGTGAHTRCSGVIVLLLSAFCDTRTVRLEQVSLNSKMKVSALSDHTVGMSVADVSQKTVANLGWDKIRLTAPVFAGDTIYAESEVIGKRESASRPHHGIVTVRTTGKKADGTVFMTFERSALIPMQGHAVDDRLDY